MTPATSKARKKAVHRPAGNPPASVPVVDVDSVTDRVAEAITSGIRSGVFVPGQHLPESTLTLRLGISRGSLREALRHLSAAGIVTLHRFRGAYISTLDLCATLDLLETLEPLARLAARLAAERCDSNEKRRRMKTAATSIESASRNHSQAQYMEQRRHFYDTLLDIGGNMELARVMPLSRTDVYRAQIERFQSERQRARHVAAYPKIAEAVASQDSIAADRAVQRHFASTRQTINELPPEAFPTNRRP
jgi:DNA-binding GntR family transcriptional regulator